MERTKEQGITLIALVITIIVLLILAGVALATLTGNSSIIDNANYAVTEYNKSANSDQNVLNQVENLFAKYMGEETKYTITYNANGGIGTMEEEEAARTAASTFTPPEGKQFKEWNTSADGSGTSYPAGAQVPSNVDLYAIWYDPLSAHVQPGDYITYNPTLGVTDASLLSYTSPVGTLKVKNSNNQYVINESGTDTNDYNGAYNLINENGEFVIPTGYMLESNVPGNGCGEQTFTATATNNLWRVLDVNTESGVVKIIPETPIEDVENCGLCFNGLRGYKNAVSELNNVSALFGHGNGVDSAKSITVEDVNRLTGYSYTKPASTTVNNLGSWYHTFYSYRKNDYPGANENITNMILGSNKDYWLASTCVLVGAGVSLQIMDVMVNKNGGVSSDGGWFASEDDYYPEAAYGGCYKGAMPVVTLKTNVENLGGDGSQTTPWIFQAAE